MHKCESLSSGVHCFGRMNGTDSSTDNELVTVFFTTEVKWKVNCFKGKLEITQSAFGTLSNWENKLWSRVLCILFMMRKAPEMKLTQTLDWDL